MRHVALVAMLGGCHVVFDLDEVDRGALEPACYGKFGAGNAGLLSVCLDAPPIMALDLPAVVDTTSCPVIVPQSNGIEVCVLSGTTVTASIKVRATGPRPLVIVATGELSITTDGGIDVSGKRGGTSGAGGNIAGCAGASGTAAPGGSEGGGGGAGGSFSDRGGPGGNGSTSSGTVRVGGQPTAAIGLDGVRGGCSGGTGGETNYAQGGAGGPSGGALYLIAGESIVVRGTLNASGGAGAGGLFPGGGNPGGGGGGGGGTGGLIALDAPVIEMVGAHLVASGGGGGGGGGTGGGATSGGAGGEADAVNGTPTFAAPGGMGGLPGGSTGGGGGNANRDFGVGGDNATAGAGGGGGSSGYIRLYASEPPMLDATTWIVPSPF